MVVCQLAKTYAKHHKENLKNRKIKPDLHLPKVPDIVEPKYKLLVAVVLY